MKISKEFRWEMGHRLPFHKGLCKNVHGHSYRMVVEVSGKVEKNGMIIDFYDLGKIIDPLIKKFDHAFMCWKNDLKMKKFLNANKMKVVVVSYPSTVENICADLASKIFIKLKNLKSYKFDDLIIKIFESPNSFAETKIKF